MKWSEYKIQKSIKDDNNYPSLLMKLSNAPDRIYYRGNLTNTLLNKSIAIIGSRRMTRYGASVVDKFVGHFVSSGITTVSGFMYGVDTEVHRKTVEYGGKTIAVLGGGIDQPYPEENTKLYTEILQTGGAVLSEYEPEMKPKLWTFPERNRIIAALSSLGILVIEASEKSGSIITVKWGRKLKKKVYAVPGPITSSVSSGTNMLIKKGVAKMVTDPNDIVKIRNVVNCDKSEIIFNSLEEKVVKLLESEELSIDELSMRLEIDIIVLSQTLTALSLNGFVSEAGGRYFLSHF